MTSLIHTFVWFNMLFFAISMVWSLALGHNHPGMTISFAEIQLFDSLLAKVQSLMYFQAPGPE